VRDGTVREIVLVFTRRDWVDEVCGYGIAVIGHVGFYNIIRTFILGGYDDYLHIRFYVRSVVA